MPITHAVFIPIIRPSLRAVDNREMSHFAVIAHLQVYTDAPVDTCARAVDVQVCDAALDDLGEDLARALVCCHADSRFVSRVEVVSDYRREVGGWDLVESVALFLVGVGEWDARRVAVWQGCFDGFVEEVVHRAMLFLIC